MVQYSFFLLYFSEWWVHISWGGGEKVLKILLCYQILSSTVLHLCWERTFRFYFRISVFYCTVKTKWTFHFSKYFFKKHDIRLYFSFLSFIRLVDNWNRSQSVVRLFAQIEREEFPRISEMSRSDFIPRAFAPFWLASSFSLPTA